MSALVKIREFECGEEQRLVQLMRQERLHHLKPLFLAAFFREITLQILMICTALLFIFCNIPLAYCLVTLPIAAIFVLAVVLIGQFLDQQEDCRTLESLMEVLQTDPKTGLWVAQAVSDQQKPQVQDGLVRIKMAKKIESGILGFCALQIKTDKNMQEPPRSVGLITHFIINKNCRRQGLGQLLFAQMWNHAMANFRAVEVRLAEHQLVARNFLERQDFSILSQTQNDSVGALHTMLAQRFLRLRRACVHTTMEDDLLQEMVVEK